MASARASKNSKSIPAEVDAYFASLPPAARKALKKLRAQVHAAVPGGEQGFTYRMPCLRLEGRPVVWYAGWKEHLSLYPITAPIRRAHAKELEGYGTSTGTLRFPLTRLPSAGLVKKIVKSRLLEMQKRPSKKKNK